MNKDNILFIESKNKYLKFYTLNEKESLLIRCTMKSAVNQLEKYKFSQSSKSALVNQNNINFIEGSVIRIATYNVALSRKYEKKFIQSLFLLN